MDVIDRWRQVARHTGLLVGTIALIVGLATMSGSAAYGTTAPPKGVNWNYIDALWATGQGSYNWAGVASDLDDMSRAGITWARVSLAYGQPFSYYDRIVSLAEAHHMHLLFLVQKGAPANDLGSTAQQTATQTWLAHAVDRYKRYVHAWEVHDEPNLAGFWNIVPEAPDAVYNASVHRYVLYLSECYRTIKAHDANATVLLGGLSAYDVDRFLGRLIAEGAGRYVDAVAFHPYEKNPQEVSDRVLLFRQQLDRDGFFKAKPIWITEIGYQHEPDWSTPGYVASEAQKATYLVQTLQDLRRDGIDTPIFWYTLHEPPDTNGFGLVRKDPLHTVYLPAFFAYQGLWSR